MSKNENNRKDMLGELLAGKNKNCCSECKHFTLTKIKLDNYGEGDCSLIKDKNANLVFPWESCNKFEKCEDKIKDVKPYKEIKTVKFEATCTIENMGDYKNTLNFIQDKLNDALLVYKNKYPYDEQISNLNIQQIVEESDSGPFVENEVCPRCGYHDDHMKVIDIKDTEITIHCPQCFFDFNISI